MHSGWVSDHVAWPREVSSKYPYTEDGSFPGGFNMPWLDPIGTLFFVAAATKKLQARHHRAHPRLPAAAAHRQDGGQPRRALRRAPAPRRGRRLDEGGVRRAGHALRPPRRPGRRTARAVPHGLHQSDTPSFDGRFYSFPEVGFSPQPPEQQGAGVGRRRLGGRPSSRTVKYGDAFHAAFQSTEKVAGLVEARARRSVRRRAGRPAQRAALLDAGWGGTSTPTQP